MQLLGSLTLAILMAACAANPSIPEVPRVPWTSVDGLLEVVKAWRPATSPDAPWALQVLIPDTLGDADLSKIRDAFRSRGYEDPHASPSVIAEVTEFEVRLVLADPVELDIPTRSVAERLWLAGIPFGTTIGNSLWLILPRRAIPAARATLSDLVPDTKWRE